jgi:polysaccharide export outer membrane protein
MMFISRFHGMATLASAACLLLLIGCTSQPIVEPINIASSDAIEDYRIGAGDTIRVDVWQNSALSITVPVRPDGKISVPLAGDVIVGDKTTEEAKGAVTQLLSNFVLDPVVTIIVLKIGSNRFRSRVRVTGAVERQLSTQHTPGMTVLDLVLEAGGVTEFASLNRAVLYRKTGERITLNLHAILNRGELKTNYTLAPGDIISVPEKGF